MQDLDRGDFQETVSQYLVRHRSILDVLSKLQEATARVNRAIAKAVTNCGCLGISAHRQEFPDDTSFHNLKEYMDTHLNGSLCESCREIIETEMGQCFFYMAALCGLLDLKMDDILDSERDRLSTLGLYNLT